MWFRKNKEMIHFSGRRHTKLGIASTAMGILSFIGFLVISFISGLAEGQGGAVIGALGTLILVLATTGFVMAYKSFQKKDIFYSFPIAGAITNAVMMIILFALYLLGI